MHPVLSLLPYRLRDRVASRLLGRGIRPSRRHYNACRLAFAKNARMELLSGDVISDRIASTGFYELELTHAIRAAEPGLMVDVGANLGYFSLVWASANARNRVQAFEAAPRNCEVLKRNIQRNQLTERVAVQCTAVGNYDGVAEFDVGPEEQTGWGGLAATKGSNTVAVPIVRLDTAIPPGTVIDVLKIDVEGADTWVLEGAENLLRTHSIRKIYFEANSNRMMQLGIDPSRAAMLLERCGYALTRFSGDQFMATSR